MNRTTRIIASAMLAAALAAGAAAAELPGVQKALSGAPKTEQAGPESKTGLVVHQELVQGIKAVFRMAALNEQMQGQKLPSSMKLTHHLMLELTDPRNGRAITRGTAMARVVAPDKSVQMKGMMMREGQYGADLALGAKGKYAVTVEFRLQDKRLRTSRFWYEVK